MTESTADNGGDTEEDDPYRIDSDAWLLWGKCIRSKPNNVITFPESVEDAQIIQSPEEDDLDDEIAENDFDLEHKVFWFCDRDQEQVLFSRRYDVFSEQNRFKPVEFSSLDSQRVTNIPKKFFADYNKYGSKEMNQRKRVDDPYLLEYGHLYYPVSPNKCFAEDNAAYLLPVEDVVDLWTARVAQTYTDEDVRDYGVELGEDAEPGGEPA